MSLHVRVRQAPLRGQDFRTLERWGYNKTITSTVARQPLVFWEDYPKPAQER